MKEISEICSCEACKGGNCEKCDCSGCDCKGCDCTNKFEPGYDSSETGL